MRNDIVHVAKSEILVDSIIIAEMLGVEHRDLLRTIRNVVRRQKNNAQASALKFPPKFFESSFKNKMGRSYPMYEMNEQGYMKLAMQLKGYEKAESVQDAIIEAFSLMKEALLNHKSAEWIESRTNLKAIRRTETDIIKQFVDYATEQGSKNAQMYYVNITKMTNKALEFLVQVKQGAPIRDLFNMEQHFFIGILDHRASEAIKFGMREQMFYKDIYKYAKKEVNTLAASMKFKPEPEMISQ